MSASRTENSIKNVKTGLIVQIVNRLMIFIVRTVFIKCLNTEYLGVNGLFTNILTILSFAELGIGTAIVFSMYKPIANDNIDKIKSLMQLYKKSYCIIGCIIFVLGLLVIPFMDTLVKDVPNIKENIVFIYLLFLVNTSASYFFTYKKSIIIAHQKQSIINNIDTIFYIIKSIIEIVILILTKNFILYLLTEITSTILENIYVSKKADKLYPYLKENDIKKLDKRESKNIFDNVKSLIVYQFGTVVMNGTDNILISALINVSTVGLCSNYTMIINAVKTIIQTALNGVTASVGNLNAVGSSFQKEKVFYQLTFIEYIIYSFCAIAFILLLNPFIKVWLGEQYLLGLSVAIALAVSFYVDGMRQPGFAYRTTLGLFNKSKTTPYIGAITNIVLSIILCKYMGVTGIFVATIIAQLVSYSWIDPYLVHKYEFKTSVKKYFKKYAIYTITFVIEVGICMCLATMIHFSSIVNLLLNGLIAIIVPNIINLFVFYRTEEFESLKEKFLPMILKKTFR